jgi:hypothetical protein
MNLSTPTFNKKKQKQAKKTLNPKRKPGAPTKVTFSVFSQITSSAFSPGCRWATTKKILIAKVEQGLGLSKFDLHLLYQCLLYAISHPQRRQVFQILVVCTSYMPYMPCLIPHLDVPW